MSDPHPAWVAHTPPPETPSPLSQPFQAVPARDREEEEEEKKRRIIPPVVPPEPPTVGNAPSVQGTPQVGTVPSVPGLGGTAATTLTAGTMAKVVVIAATCAAVIFAGIKVLPPILSHAPARPLHMPTPTPSLSQFSIYVSSADGNIYALNASSGTLRWKYPTGSQTTQRMQVADGVIYYIADSDATQSSTMYELNAHTGTLIRQYQLPYFQLETGSYIPDFTVVNGVIYFSSPTMAFALRASNGTMLWQYSWSGRGASAPVVVNNVVYYVTGVGIIHAFNIHNGSLLWKHDLGPEATSPGSIMGTYPTPVVTNDTMYVVGWLTDNMYAINLRDQTLRWHTQVNGGSTEALFAANGALYLDTSANSPQASTIHALRADNGTQLWSRNNFSLQLIDSGILYGFAVDSNGSVTNDLNALRSSDGTTLWHIQIGSPYGKVAVSHMVVYVITDTILYALRANDRSVLWQTPISGYMVGPTFSSASFPAASPTSLSASTPTPSQTLLYSANWTNGFNGWNGSSEWSAANGELRSDGREHGHPRLNPGTVSPNYSRLCYRSKNTDSKFDGS